MWIPKWIRSNNNIETVDNEDTQDVQGNVCDTPSPCEQADCLILDLRKVQNMIQEMELRLKNLQNKYFPMLFWWIAATMDAGRCMPGRYERDDFSNLTRGDIELCLQRLTLYLSNRNIMTDDFDVDQFCSEVRDYIKNDAAIKQTEESISKLKAEEKRIKGLLGIV